MSSAQSRHSGHGRWVGVQGRSATRGVDSTSVEPDKVKPCVNPWKKEEEESVSLDKNKVSGYRQLVARADFLAQDRADIQFAEGGVPRHGKPDKGSLETGEAPSNVFERPSSGSCKVLVAPTTKPSRWPLRLRLGQLQAQ